MEGLPLSETSPWALEEPAERKTDLQELDYPFRISHEINSRVRVFAGADDEQGINCARMGLLGLIYLLLLDSRGVLEAERGRDRDRHE